ncbi:MAG: DUF2256 and DUF3253 domain-containing protein [Pseudomonadota bacterium]
MNNPKPPDKICRRCGRPFSWRRKWSANWASVVYCSERCRRRRLSPTDQAIEETIIRIVTARSTTCCPSDVAKVVASANAKPDDWRQLMEPVREAARRLARRGELQITQRAVVVDPDDFRGPIRLGRP